MLQYLQSLPPRTLFYVGAAAAVGLLLIIRFFRLRASAARTAAAPPPKAEQPEAPQPIAATSTPAAKPTVAVPAVAADVATAKPVETAASVDPGKVEPVKATKTVEPNPPVRPVSARPEPVQMARTFTNLRTEDNGGFPRLEAADLPIAGDADRAFGGLTPYFAAFVPENDERRAETKRELANAGYFQPHAYENLQAARYLAMFGGLVLAATLLLLAPPRFEPYAVASLIALPLLGWALPRLLVRGKAADRRTEIEKAMPDMLDMLNMCVSQGMTVPAALQRVSVELPKVHPALHRELQIINDQSRISNLDVALENFRRRMDVPEVHSFCNLMLQTQRMGTSVSTALQEYSDNMRASLQQRADEKGNQAAFKLLFPTVLCLMPAIYMVLLGPAVVGLQRYRDTQAQNESIQQSRQILNNRR